MDARQLYREGRLEEAIQAMNEEVRKNPADVSQRGFLSELLCIAGNLDRADALLETVTNQAPKAGVGAALVRHLIRAERSRQELFFQGRVPDLLADPSPSMRLRLEATVMLRDGDTARAAELLAQVERERRSVSGTMGGERFEDLRDLDDVVGDVFEVLTSTGKYYWITMDTVERFAPRKPERPLDLLWLPVEMTVRDGPDGVVYIPTIYASRETEDAGLRLGRSTQWTEDPSGIVRGQGLRSFLVGEEDKTILELGEIFFDAAESPLSR